MRERVCTFGSHGGMVGVLCEPDHGADVTRPAVLLYNVGLNHHVGPNRLNVDLSRHLARLGFVSLRFDLSGLGDSESRRDRRSDEERSVVDLQEAMDYVTQRKRIASFIVVGLCSGVDPAHVVAVSDPRVSGAVFIDGYAYVTADYRFRRMIERVSRMLQTRGRARWVRQHIFSYAKRQGIHETGMELMIFDREYPAKSAFKNDLASMLSRPVQVLFLYTRHAYFFNHPGQFTRMLGIDRLPAGVEVERLSAADHIFTAVGSRQAAIHRICGWVFDHFGVAGAPRNGILALRSSERPNLSASLESASGA